MENPKNDVSTHSLEKLIDRCEFWSESKESTVEESYDEMVKHRAELRKRNYLLKQDLKKYKQGILSRCLGIYIEQLNQLNKQNQYLRSQYRQVHQSKKPTQLSSSKAPRQSLRTPKSRKSIGFGEQQNRQRKQQGRKSLISQVEKGINLEGRNSLQSPRVLKHNENRMTERKVCIHSRFSSKYDLYSQCGSLRSSLRPSIDKQNNNTGNYRGQKNMFLNLVNVILQEEKIKQKQYYEMIQDEKGEGMNRRRMKGERFYINDLENELILTEKNIQKMTKALNYYENSITDMKMQISTANKMTQQLFQLKEQFIQMQNKCQKINSLKKELKRKEYRLEQLQSVKARTIQPPESMKLMLRVYGVEEYKIKDAGECKAEVKKIAFGKLGKPSKKKMKIKELLDTVREGRKKFKELMNIYNGRISKLETKIHTFKRKESRRKKNNPV